MSKSTYRAVVGKNNTAVNFKSEQHPAKVTVAQIGTPYQLYRLDYEIVDDESGQWKFFLPPGTVAFNANLYYFLAAQEGKSILSVYRPTDLPLSYVNQTNANRYIDERLLDDLLAGVDATFYCTGAPANSMLISSPNNVIEPISIGEYIYGKHQYPGGRLQRGLIQVFVKAEDYEKWFYNAVWDSYGNPDENAVQAIGSAPVVHPPAPPAPQPTPTMSLEDRAIARANKSGLAGTMMLFGNCKTDVELVEKANATGVFAALLDFMKMSEDGTH